MNSRKVGKVGLRLITSRDGLCKNARVYLINLNGTLELAAGRGAYGGKVSLSFLNDFFENISGACGGINFLNLLFGAGPDIICFLRQSQGIIRFADWALQKRNGFLNKPVWKLPEHLFARAAKLIS